MTTIAWDGRTLAADRAAWSSGNKYRVRKVYKVRAPDGRRFLVAFSGDANYCFAVLGWMRGGPRPGAYPNKDGAYTIAVVIDEKNRIWRMDSDDLKYVPVLEKIHASGAGQDYAIGALEAGATATEAIRITIKRSDYAALGVDSVRF